MAAAFGDPRGAMDGRRKIAWRDEDIEDHLLARFSNFRAIGPAAHDLDARWPGHGVLSLAPSAVRIAAVRAAADQSAAPEVDHALIDRYVAGQLDEHARRYVVRMTLQHANWDQAYGEALRRTIAESN